MLALLSTGAMGLTDDIYLWVALRFVSGVSSTAGLLIASGPVLNWLMRHGHRPELGLHFAGIGLGIVVSGLAVAAMLHRHHHRQLRRGPGGRRRGDGLRDAVPARRGSGAAAGEMSRAAQGGAIGPSSPGIDAFCSDAGARKLHHRPYEPRR